MRGNNGRSWKEEIYWTHFQFLHFAQFLPSTFHQHLALPKTFSDNIKKKLPENVVLKGPSGGVVWNIGITTRDDTLYFTHRWAQFAKDHSLKENDFLVFKYNGDSLFEVMIFDGESFCEKPASYFVRKCQHANAEHNDPNKSVKDDFNTPSNGSGECVSHEKSVHLNTTQVTLDDQLQSKTPNGKSSHIGVESGCTEKLMDDTITKTKPAAVNLFHKKRSGRPPRACKSLNGVAGWCRTREDPNPLYTNPVAAKNVAAVGGAAAKNVAAVSGVAAKNFVAASVPFIPPAQRILKIPVKRNLNLNVKRSRYSTRIKKSVLPYTGPGSDPTKPLMVKDGEETNKDGCLTQE